MSSQNVKPGTLQEQSSRIIGIQFSMLSPEEIRRNSVVEITSRNTYSNNKPEIGGLFDPRMGVLEPGLICPTDGYTYIDTPGYFGHIELARPVFFMQHIKEIMKILRCICFKCSKLLINKNQHKHIIDWPNEKRWGYIDQLFAKKLRSRRCGESTEDGCGCKQPDNIKLEGFDKIYAIWDNIQKDEEKEQVNIRVTPEMVIKIFRRMSDQDISFLGFSPVWSRPEWMVCKVLPVAPPSVRPSVKHDAQQRSEDDLTQIYNNIIKTNHDLMDKIQNNANASVIDGLTMLLQYYVAMIANNKVKGSAPMAHRSGRPLQCIMGRLNSKNGRIRGNLMGKRVDFSARSVITGDPNLSIRQLGVPLKIAKNITKPVVVNDRNRDFLMKLIENGPDEHPGAKILERRNGMNISLRNIDRRSIVLENGDIVHRHMMDGDAVLFNRQPSLHRMSMMCHIVKVMKVGDTFRMNIGTTKPYNADFDGDEMNMHMPQNVLAETELKHLAAIPWQIVSPSNNTPIIGIYQDSMLGSFQFTRDRIEFTPREAMNILMGYSNVDVNAFNKKVITNFDILSQIMPHVSLKYKNKLFKDGEDEETSNNIFELRNGEYVRGQLEKSVLASSTKGIIHRAFNDYGNMAASNFIDNLQSIVTEYMKSSSFSVGVSDLIANKETQVKIGQAIMSQKLEVQSVIEKVHLGIFENDTSNTNMAEFEMRVNNILNKATEQSGKIGHGSLGKDNRFLKIVNSGSKGSLINISQMISCLGQQNVDGKRIPYGFENRTLPHYYKFDDSPEARGFIENSYISGLTAPELFFHAMGGRIGLIDTAVKTSQTGYIQRRLIKGLEDLKAEYDGTIRNNRRKIVQFAYGDDGFDSTRAENQGIKLVEMSVEDIYMHYDIAGINDERNDLLSIYTKSTLARLNKQRKETADKCKIYIDMMLEYRDNMVERVFMNKNDNSVKVPVAFQHIIANIQGQLGFSHNSSVDITPLEVFQMIEETYNKLERLNYAKPTELFKALYFFYLSPKELVIKKRFHHKAIQYLLETIVLRYKQAIVHPGEMVGVIAGQSIGEPTTQLTLNSVTYETEILVRNKCGEINKVHIGDFITENIKQSEKVDYMEDKDTTYAELGEKYYEVPCATEDGHTVWRRIEAVTQHPVINEDGTNTMLRIVTEGNREVIATKAKSFLQLVDGKIVGVEGKTLKVGDYLPVSKKELVYTNNIKLNLRDILPTDEYLYGSEMKKAMNVMHERHWWMNHANSTFVVPHSRSDSFVCLAKSGKNIQDDCVYMKLVNMCEYKIPEFIELDYDFGYFIGAYTAEGCMTNHQISIANNDLEYLKPIERLCERFNITTKIYKVCNKIKNGWTSQDIRIYNTLLCRIVEQLCGKLSHGKFISDKILFSNKECISGFLDAYIGGDGCIAEKHNRIQSIDMTSVSKNLLEDIQIMLKNLGIVGTIHKPTKIEKNNRGTLSCNIKEHYYLTVRNQQAQKLGSMLNLTITSKQERVERLLTQSFQYEYNKDYLTVPNIVNDEIVMMERLNRYSDLLFDKIISIEEVENTTNYAYDLTVEDTRNFDIYNGICMRDTFHLAGVSTKSNVTRGVPRIEEILRLTKNPKQPYITIMLNTIDQENKERAEQYAKMIEHTKLIDVVQSVQICFDPREDATFIEKDREVIEQFYEFEKLLQNAAELENVDENQSSKWVLRMEMDPEKMLDKNITMDDIHYTISATHGDNINTVFSDYNDKNLVFRIRMNSAIFDKKRKRGVLESMDQSDEIYHLKNFQDTLLNNIVLRGVNGIQNVMPRQIKNRVVKEDGKYVSKDIWILETTGTNLLEILAQDYIDSSRTYCNDIQEIFNVLGIEAARQTIFNEFNEVMEFSDNVYINYHHLSLLCDRMTLTQKMVPIFRSGILEDDIGTIAKATFEVHTEVFLDAARHGNFDEMRGVSANIMCGQYGYYGTNAFNVVLDMKEMIKLKNQSISMQTETEKINKMFGLGGKSSSDICSKSNIMIRNNISNIKTENIENCDDSYDIGI